MLGVGWVGGLIMDCSARRRRPSPFWREQQRPRKPPGEKGKGKGINAGGEGHLLGAAGG